MNRKNHKKIGIVLLLLLQLSQVTIPSIYALTMDGSIDEDSWSLWFIDSYVPSYSSYFSENSTNVHLGIVTNNTDLGDNQLQIGFKADKNDWLLMYSDISGCKFKTNKDDPGSGELYWGSTKLGLPEGVNIVQGFTNGNISYEISISKELLGKYSEEYPEKFTFWLMYATDCEGGWIWSVTDTAGEVNFFPESREGWWFCFTENDIEEFVEPKDTEEVIEPVFHAPEVPYGTIISLITMFSSILIVSNKKNSNPL